MTFFKKEQNGLQLNEIKNKKANIIGFFIKSQDQKNIISFEKIFYEEFENKRCTFHSNLFWEAQSKHLFIGEGDLPFDRACLLKFSDSYDLVNFLESNFLKKLKGDFQNKGDELKLIIIKEHPLPIFLKFLMVIFRVLGKLIPFYKIKGEGKNDFKNFGGINPRLDQIDTLKSSKLEGPLHMINFLSFKGKKGFYDYQKYGFVALRGVLFLGGNLSFLGRIIDKKDSNWSQMVIMEYPTIESFMNLIYMPGYARATFWRAKGLLKTLLIISKPSKKNYTEHPNKS